MGDCASCTPHPRPKAGVYAVRQGPPLDHNLRAFLTGQPLTPFVPQSTNLSLVTTGVGRCGRHPNAVGQIVGSLETGQMAETCLIVNMIRMLAGPEV